MTMEEYQELFEDRLAEAKYFLQEAIRLGSKELEKCANEAITACNGAIKNARLNDAEAYHNDLMSFLWECSELREEIEE